MTSGASETILRNFFSRSSRATGPNTRVPTGSFASLITTAAFWSKRIYVPSRRRYSLRVRTITAFTTLPFLTVPSGEASFTAAVMISPSEAFLPRPPPSGRIICSLRAPELSATASMDLIWTAMDSSPYPPALVGCRYWFDRRRVFKLAQRRAPHDLFQGPALQLARRTRLADPHHIAHAGGVLLVVRIKLLRALHDSLVLRMSLAHLDLDHNGLLHLGRNYVAHLLITPRCRRLRLFCRRRHLFTGSLLLCRLRDDRRRFAGLGAANPQRALPRYRLDLGDLFAQLAELLHSIVLPQRYLEAQPEQLLGRRLLVVRELFVAQVTNLFQFHLVCSQLSAASF